MEDGLEFEWDDSVFLKCYRYLLNLVVDIYFLWGGRDSGKSRHVAQWLIIQCLEQDYFRCILVRKTFNSIKGSQFQLIQDIVSEWGLDDWFKFNQTTLEIQCVNGNKFIARGCDDPAKIKSLSNPTHAWFEESNQLTIEDYIVVATTLRSNEGRVQQYHTFNPEADGDYEEHWLWPYFRKHVALGEYTFTDTISMTLPNGEEHSITYSSTHTTYKDNPFVTPDRIGILENLKVVDEYWYNVFTLGEWGNIENDSPFIFAYDKDKHDGFPAWNPNEITHLSFDFNKNPMCCSVIQHYDGAVKVLRTIKLPNSSTPEMCEHIQALYPGATFMVTGDATGQNRSPLVAGNEHHYTVIKSKLGLGTRQFQVPSVNPGVKANGLFANTVLANYPVEIHVNDAKPLRDDFRNVRRRPDGTIEKGDRENPTKQADALDTFLYFVNAHLRGVVNFAVQPK